MTEHNKPKFRCVVRWTKVCEIRAADEADAEDRAITLALHDDATPEWEIVDVEQIPED